MPIKVLIVDDEALVRHGLNGFLELDSAIEVVGEARNGEQALQLALQLRPDVVLMDLRMPGMDGLSATRHLRQQLPTIRIVIISALMEPVTVAQALEAGADGYLLKIIEPEELIGVIKAVASGLNTIFLSPQLAFELFNRAKTETAPHSPTPKLVQTGPEFERFTPRELKVLQMLSQGMSNKQIGYSLKVSEKTIKLHMSVIMGKLGVQSRTQAALYALQTGLVEPEKLRLENGEVDD